MKNYVATGLTVLAGVALFEAALVPAVVIGGAAVLAPKYLPALRRRLRPTLKAMARRPAAPASSANGAPGRKAPEAPVATIGGFGIGQAIAKTITFRVIVTTLDFTTNYVVIGELTTAAGLSTFNLIVGPLFYLGHEAAWNYLGPTEDVDVDVRLPTTFAADGKPPPAGVRGIRVSRALAKTVTFRTIATIMDFTTNYVVVGDAITAAGLSAFGFVLGPFVYYGHERIWDYYTSSAERSAGAPTQTKLLPASG
jgi:uncharacterized membrane protein